MVAKTDIKKVENKEVLPYETSKETNVDPRKVAALESESQTKNIIVEEKDEDKSFFESWPFWTGVGVAVIGGTVAAVALNLNPGSSSCDSDCVDFN